MEAGGQHHTGQVSHEQCARYIVQQAAERGEGGILYVRGSEWAYLLPEEWPAGIFREKMEEAMAVGGAASFFVVVHPEDNNVSVFSIPKETAVSICLGANVDAAAPSQPTSE